MMSEQEFKEWYDWVKERADAYQDLGERMAVITGLFKAWHEETFTGDQVIQILALRYPENEKAPV